MMEANYEELFNNICYVIKEQHIKLGYSDNSRWLYYPLSALNHLIGTDCDNDGMEEALAGFFEYAKDRFGPGKATHKGDRFCLHMDPQASAYVRDNVPEEPFLVELVDTLAEHGTTMDQVVDVFRKYSDKVHAEPADSDKFDLLVYFDDG